MIRAISTSAAVLASMALLFTGSAALRAEESSDLGLVKKPAAADNRPAAEPGTSDDAPERPVETSPPRPASPALDDELFQRLGGQPPAKEKGHSIDDVVQGMRDAQQRLAERDAGRTTQDIQAEVVRQLEQLIEQARQSQSNPNQPPMPSTSQQQPQSQAQQQQDRQQQPNQKSADQQTAEAEQQQNQTQQGTQENQRAKESTDETREARQREAELARRADMVKEVWGHLPPAIRAKLMNIYGEEYLPKYEEEVRRYFESLAEPRDRER